MGKIIKINFILPILFLLFFCSVDRSIRQNQTFARERNFNNRGNSYITGVCSYYGKKFHGRKTASGEFFDMFALTAAHKSLPFGTILEVENLVNGKKVRVRINDRGPFVRDRILDLSFAAAKKIDMIKTGTTKIRAKIIK